MFIRRTGAEAEDPMLWPPDPKSQVMGKDPELGKREGKRRRKSKGWRWLVSVTDSMDMNLSKI